MKDSTRDKEKLLPKGYNDIQSLQNHYNAQKDNRLKHSLIHWDRNCHTQAVTSITMSSDGKRIISGSMDNTIRVFDIEKKAQINCIFTDQSDGLNSISVSDDDKKVVCATGGQAMMVFDLETSERLQYVGRVHRSPMQFAKILRDKRYILSAGLHETIKIYGWEKKEEVYEFKNLSQDNVESVIVSDDSSLVAFVSNSTSIKVYDIQKREEIQYFHQAHSGGHISSLAISKDKRYLVSGSTDIRVFDLKTKEEVVLFQGFQEDPVRSVMVSNDNKFIIVGSNKGSIKVFNFEEKQHAYELLNMHQSAIRSIAISNDNKHAVTGSDDATIKLFDLETFKEIHHFKRMDNTCVGKLAVSKDSKLLISSFEDNSIRIIDLETSQEIHRFEKAHEKWISGIKVSYDNNYIVSVGRDSTIKIFDIKKKNEVASLANAHKDNITSLALSSNGKHIITSSYDGSVKIIEVISKSQDEKELKEIYNFEKAHECTTSVAISKDSKFIIACSMDKSAKVFDFNTKEQLLHIENLLEETAVSSFLTAATSDGKYLVAAKGMEMRVFNLETKKQMHHFAGAHKDIIMALALSDDDKYIVTGSGYNTVKVLDLHSGQQLHHYSKVHSDTIMSVAISGDNQKIISGAQDGGITVLKLEQSQQLDHITNIDKSLNTSFAVTSDGKYLILGLDSGAIKVINMLTKNEVYQFEEKHKSKVIALALSNDDKFVVCISEDKSIKFFDLETRTLIHTLQDAHKDKLMSLAISPDDSRIMTGTEDGIIKIFDIKKKAELHSFAHTPNQDKKIITAVAFSPDNKYLVSSSSDNSIKIWDASSYKLVFAFSNAHQAQIGALAVTRDSKLLISSSKYIESVKVWDLETMQEVHHFGNHKGSYYMNVKYKTGISITKNDKYAVVLLGEEPPKAFDLQSMQQVHQFNKSEISFAQAIALTNDDNLMITRQVDGSVKVHNMPFVQNDQIHFASSHVPAFLLVGEYDTMLFRQCSGDADCLEKFLTSYPDLHVEPHNWTILHLMAIFRPYDISKVALYPQHKTPFLVDAYGKTPLHYLISHDKLDYSTANLVLKYMLDYIEHHVITNPYEYKIVCNSLTELFSFIIEKANPRLAEKFLELCFRKSTCRQGEAIPSFGNAVKRHIISKIPAIQPDVQAKIYEDGNEQITFQTNMLYLDYDPGSDDMVNCLTKLAKAQNGRIFKTPAIEHLIDYIWDSAKPIIMIIALLFSLLMTLLSVYISLGERNIGLEAAILILTLLFNVIQAVKTSSIKGIWSHTKIHLLLLLLFIISKSAGIEAGLGQQLVGYAALVLGFLRWTSYLQLFSLTRVLIQCVISLYLLLSGLGDSSLKMRNKRILICSVARIEIILEALMIQRRISGRRESEKGYLIFCEPEAVREEDEQEVEWEDRIKDVKKLLQYNLDDLKARMENTDEEIRKRIEVLEKLIVGNHNQILTEMKNKTS